ncbi:MAG: twin-arginine translocation signal domain-containing protein [Bacteroidia bacterium]|nr:twin-arginine translocation signal domain-containing protein [Bacteroidia bacterium]
MKNPVTRREFLRTTGVAGVATLAGAHLIGSSAVNETKKKITITEVSSNFEREPLIRPFGFKGGYMTEIWQTVNYLKSSSGEHKIGLCTQNVLWSDAQVFAAHSESGGNAVMFALTERALQIVKGQSFGTPVELLDNILPEVYEFGKKITSRADLRKTFALNALVGIDNAAWLLYAKENGLSTFDEMIPPEYKPALSNHHDKVAAIPLMAYNIPIDEIEAAVNQGYFFMKIKIGQPGTQEEMLEKDKARLSAIHQAIGNIRTPHTKDGRLPYYFDANGRYEKKESLLKLLDHARKIGAFEQIAIIEEPFAEEPEIDVSDIPVRLAADESAHTDADAIKRIQMGYKAIALKAIAKTLSMTMKIAQAAYERNIPCFCADLTVNPVLVEWNKNVAARLKSLPGMGSLGLMESNGHQNYKNWSTMMSYHPRGDAPWVKVINGVYELNSEFYRTGGGIFDKMPHYEEMFSYK